MPDLTDICDNSSYDEFIHVYQKISVFIRQISYCIFRADFDVPLVPDSSRYEIKKYKKLGRIIIINNENFHDGKRREGTDVRITFRNI